MCIFTKHCDHHFMMCVSQVIMPYTLNIYSAIQFFSLITSRVRLFATPYISVKLEEKGNEIKAILLI